MNSKKIKKEYLQSIPVLYGFIQQYRRFIDNKNPERVGVDYDEFGAKHFFPYGLNKPISRVVDYENITEFKYGKEDEVQ